MVVLKEVVIFGVAPPVDERGNEAVTLVTVPCGCAVQPTTPDELVVRALTPLQLEADPMIAKFVVVALVVVALVESVEEAITESIDPLNHMPVEVEFTACPL